MQLTAAALLLLVVPDVFAPLCIEEIEDLNAAAANWPKVDS